MSTLISKNHFQYKILILHLPPLSTKHIHAELKKIPEQLTGFIIIILTIFDKYK